MLGGLGVGELSIILVIVVVLFGAGRLAGIGSGLGRGIKNFKSEVETDPKKVPESTDSTEENKEES